MDILIPILMPVCAGIIMLMPVCKSFGCDSSETSLKKMHIFVVLILSATSYTAVSAAFCGEGSLTWFELFDGIDIYFHIDSLGTLFITVVGIVWTLIGIYACSYMKHEGRERSFFGYYLIVFGILNALCFSGNLITMYLFYELMSIASMPLVLHNRSREAVMAALKYLFYSMCGAYLGLFGIFFMNKYCDTLTFTAGGTLNSAAASSNTAVVLAAVFCMIIGFGAKAGMFPLHSWLPSAHPVAPSPASAALSGIIAKAGVLATIRVVFYITGADFIRGTWVQTAWMTLTLLTIFMGSMLAFKEPVFKKRLAYSTVSQVSYILFGLSTLCETALTGALLHVVFHAVVKSALFLTAGVFIFKTGKTRVEQFGGIGKYMPKTLWCCAFASLALIGIPPTCGFISKWYLAQGALEADIGAFGWIGPVVLLVSALLTAGYLLPVVTNGFFPKRINPDTENDAHEESEKTKNKLFSKDPSMAMLIPLAVLASLSLYFGLFPNVLTEFVSKTASLLF